MHTLDEWNAELVLTNSHDALCAYVLQIGSFRRICSNGLVVSDETFSAIHFRPSGLKTEEAVRSLGGIDSKVSLNKGLWSLAEQVAAVTFRSRSAKNPGVQTAVTGRP